VNAGSQVLLEKQGSTTTATYTYGNALIRKDGEVPLFDGLASERTVTDSNQSVTGTLTTEGFGQTVATTGSSTNPYMFAATSGYRNDGDAGLMHVGARYYDAQVGRFVTRDTVLSEQPYVYCDADPVNAVDPTGHDVKEVIHQGWDYFWGGVGAAIGVIVGGTGGAAATAPAGGEGAAPGVVWGGIIGASLGGMFGEATWQLMVAPWPWATLGDAAKHGGTPFIPY
jgi:RHS repeat-associated protein